MIFFTGRGEIFQSVKSELDCNVLSIRDTSDSQLIEFIERANFIFHNSALITATSNEDYVKSNFLPTKRLVDLVIRYNRAVKFIYFSSMSILASHDCIKTSNTMDGYALSKFMGEWYSINSSLDNCMSLRFSTIFYRNPLKDGLSRLIHSAVTENRITLYNDGSAKRDFLPINYLAKYIKRLVDAKPKGKKIYNISTGVETSFVDIAHLLHVQIPGLRIDNSIATDMPEVLSKFGTNPLGYFDFDIKTEAINYLHDLRK